MLGWPHLLPWDCHTVPLAQTFSCELLNATTALDSFHSVGCPGQPLGGRGQTVHWASVGETLGTPLQNTVHLGILAVRFGGEHHCSNPFPAASCYTGWHDSQS